MRHAAPRTCSLARVSGHVGPVRCVLQGSGDYRCYMYKFFLSVLLAPGMCQHTLHSTQQAVGLPARPAQVICDGQGLSQRVGEGCAVPGLAVQASALLLFTRHCDLMLCMKLFCKSGSIEYQGVSYVQMRQYLGSQGRPRSAPREALYQDSALWM